MRKDNELERLLIFCITVLVVNVIVVCAFFRVFSFVHSLFLLLESLLLLLLFRSLVHLKALNIRAHCIFCLFVAVAHEMLFVRIFLSIFFFVYFFSSVHSLLLLLLLIFFFNGPYFTMCALQ